MTERDKVLVQIIASDPSRSPLLADAVLADVVHGMLARVARLELSAPGLTRALEPFRTSVRTIGALHLVSLDYFRRNGQSIDLASYDRRMVAAARATGIRVSNLRA